MFRKTPGFRVFFWIFTVTIGGFIFLPLLWMINTALKPAAETFTLDFFTGTKTMENFAHIVTDGKIMRYLRNSLLVSFGSSLMATIVCAFAAYSFSKFRYRGRKLVMGLFMMSQAFPQAILLLSIYVLMQKTGLLGSYWALLISYVVFTLPVGTWTLKSYFDQLPDSLIESARIDGAGNLKIMFQIVFPITVPGMISIAIYGFVWSWNDLLYSMLNHYETPGYGFQLRHGATTLTEQWDPNQGSSLNHFMMGQIDEWLFKTLAGIQNRPGTYGLRHLLIKPTLVGDLKYVNASTESLYGKISVSCTRSSLTVDIPVGSDATIVLPDGTEKQVGSGKHTFNF